METIYFLLTLININFIKCDNSITYEGRYIQPPPAIEICISDKKQMKESIIHELWHFFYFKFLNEYDQKLWSILYNKSTIDDYVTWYAMSNEYEDFAETFAIIFTKEKYDKTELIENKIKYIKYLINKYLWQKK